MFAGQPLGLRELTDFLYVYRFRGLLPDIDRMGPFIRQGQDLLATEELNFEPDQIGAFCENAAAGLIRHGRLDEAQSLLERITNSLYYICLSDRVQAQLMALQAELYRRRGDRRRAARSLHEARRLQQDEGWLGDLAFSTYLTLAKYEHRTSRALNWINQAKEIQTRNQDHLGLTVSLLLEARLQGNPTDAEPTRRKVQEFRERLPALGECTFLAQVLEHWEAWTTGGLLHEGQDPFWGL